MLQELGKQNPRLVTLIQEHQADFLRLINDMSPSRWEQWFYIIMHSPLQFHIFLKLIFLLPTCRNAIEQLEAAMPQAFTVTPEEREAIRRVRSFFSFWFV